MKVIQQSDIRQNFHKHIEDNTLRYLLLKVGLSLVILFYFVYSDIGIRQNYLAAYTRILPIGIGALVFFIHLIKPHKWFELKFGLYNTFLLSLSLMMYGKGLVHLHDQALASVVSGTILIIFLISLEIKTKTIISIFIFFVPAFLFVFLLLLIFEVKSEEMITLSNIYPIIVFGFLLNRMQYRMRFDMVKSNFLLEKETRKTENLYQDTLVMNEKLHQQKEEIIVQRDEIQSKKNEIERQHVHITDSIKYARIIQDAMLPDTCVFEENFKEYFILNKPLDIIGGDFYWAESLQDKTMYAVADSTGHGVPGAVVSILGISLLNKLITQSKEMNPAQVLNTLRSEVKKTLKQKGEHKSETKEGMDIALCIIDNNTGILNFSGAYMSVYIYREGDLIELKADRQPIGLHAKEKPFVNHEFQLLKNDILYSFSDGFIDQFNESQKRYMLNRFEKLLKKIGPYDLKLQKKMLEEEYNTWKSTNEQTDDILVVGVKIR